LSHVGSKGERTTGEEDFRLAQLLVERQPEAANLAWRRFHPLVETTLRRMLGPGGDVQDLTQEVFLRFFRKVEELRKLESLRAFVLAIAIRRAQEEIKRRRVRKWFAPLIGEHLDERYAAQIDPVHRQAIGRLYALIDRLGVKDRTLYILRYIEGLEHAQISEAMGISVSTVRRRLVMLSRRMGHMVQADAVLAEYLGQLRESGAGKARGEIER
jgi:RNA polymerase sigma-70 factor (ECF subfamily)